MFYFEFNQQELTDTKLCYNEDYTLHTSLEKAIESVSTENAPFAYFNLNMPTDVLDSLSKVQVTKFNAKNLRYSNNLTHTIREFIGSLGFTDQNTVAINTDILSTHTTKIINAVMATSQQDDAMISLIAHTQDKLSPYWHIDKALEEIAGYRQLPSAKFFIFALKGSPTLFYNDTSNTRPILYQYLANYTYVYGYNISQGKPPEFEGLFQPTNIYSPQFGQGSVHLAGFQSGAIHATPDDNERVVVIIKPASKHTIDAILSS